MKYAQKNTTVIKTMDILNLFVDHAQMSLSELMKNTNMPRTSLLRMLTSLEEIGFLRRDAMGNYELGLSFLQFGQLVAERMDIRAIALPVMRQLQLDADEAVNLVITDGQEALYIEKIDTSHQVKVYTRIGRRAPLFGGACPRILLAFMPDADRERYLEETALISYAKGTILGKQELRRELEEVRRLGYSVSHGELQDFTSAVAAPIYNQHGQVIASLSLAGLTERFKGERLQLLIDLVSAAAREISIRLGWRK